MRSRADFEHRQKEAKVAMGGGSRASYCLGRAGIAGVLVRRVAGHAGRQVGQWCCQEDQNLTSRDRDSRMTEHGSFTLHFVLPPDDEMEDWMGHVEGGFVQGQFSLSEVNCVRVPSRVALFGALAPACARNQQLQTTVPSRVQHRSSATMLK